MPRDVRIAAFVMGGSAAGDMAAQAALTLRWHAGGGTAVSVLLLANALPVLVCVPIAGVLADRVDSRRLLVGCSVVCAGLCAGLAAARPDWLVLLLIACVAAVATVTSASLGALVPVMAGRDGVVRANSVLRGALMVASVAGLAVGGAGSQWWATGPVLVLDGVTFVGLAVGASMIGARRGGGLPATAHRRPARGRGVTGHGAGARWTVALSYAMVLLLVSTTNVAQVFFVKDVLGASDLGFGVVSGCWTIGTIVALPWMSRVAADPELLGRLTILGGAVTGAAIAGCGAAASTELTAAMYVLGGAGSCVMQVARGSYLQLTAPEASRGRQLAGYNAVAKTASVVALVLGGQLVDAAGPRATYLLAGVGAVGVMAWAGARWSRVGADAHAGDPGIR